MSAPERVGGDGRRPVKKWLVALGLHRRELRAWALYDWANSAFATTIMVAVFPFFWRDVSAAAFSEATKTAYWGFNTSLGLLLVAVVSPVLGAMADYLGAKKRFLAAFAGLGIVFTALLATLDQGQWLLGLALYLVAYVGFAGANVFYESLLPHVARDDETDRVSTAGYAVGYLGGGALLALNLAWVLAPQRFGLPDTAAGVRLSLVSVAVWWAVFSVPLFRRVREPPARLEPGEVLALNPVRVGFGRVWETLKEVRSHPQVFLFLLAFWCYNDGVGTIIKMATSYGDELGLGRTHMITAILIVQFVGIPFAFAFGALADRIGTKNGIYVTLVGYMGVAVGGVFLRTALHFYLLAFAVAMFQGGVQALSRSLYASLVPRAKSSEFFGFYSVSAKFAGILGPLAFGGVALLFDSSRPAILFLLAFFVGGMLLLRRVDVEEGRRAARAEDRAMAAATPAADPR